MEAVPFGRVDVADDGVVGPLWGNRFAKGDGEEEPGGGAFGVDGWVDGARIQPVLGVGGDVGLTPVANGGAKGVVAGLVVGRRTACVPISCCC